MINQKRISCFVSVCDKCGEINIFPKSDRVPAYCMICGQATIYGSGYITKNEDCESHKDKIINELAQQSYDERMFTLLNTKVDEVYETEDIQEVIDRVHNMWILLGIATKRNVNPVYILGHLKL